MAIVLRVDGLNTVLGEWQFLETFFATICSSLEGGKLGSTYPHIMGDFYDGNLPAESVPCALNELNTIEQRMFEMSPSSLVMDRLHPEKEQVIPEGAKVLKDCFFDSNGRDLIKFIRKYFEFAIDEKASVEIVSVGNLPKLRKDKPKDSVDVHFGYRMNDKSIKDDKS